MSVRSFARLSVCPWHFGIRWKRLNILKLVPLESLGAVSYSPSTAIMAVFLAVCEIFSIKEWRDLENQARTCSRSLKMTLFDRPYATFYWSANSSILYYFRVFWTLNTTVTLKSGLAVTQSHWHWCHWKAWVRFPLSTVTMVVSVAVCKTLSVKEWCDLENRVRVRSRSLDMAPFDRLHMTSCSHPIVTVTISCTVCEI